MDEMSDDSSDDEMPELEDIQDLYDSLWRHMTTDDQTPIYLDIETIDHIRVKTRLEYRSTHALRLRICDVWTSRLMFQVDIHSANDLRAFRFTGPQLKYNLEKDNFGLGPFGSTNLGDECCVCLENCVTKTSCGHYLCRFCQDKLQTLRCPMCRAHFRG